LNDLYPLDEELSSKQTLRDFEMDWNSRSGQKSYRLATSTLISLRRLFLIPVVPNIIVMGLTFAQPYLVSILLSYISSSQSKETGYLIVVGYAVVYPALAIFTAFQSHQVDRFVTMVRACLVTIIYQKTLTLDLKEASRGESLTLMSADVERVALGFKTLHQCAANIAMSILALGLLYLQIGLR
jgi:ATP-binding cassette subfamily C (CFTR/MRP) protein 1